VEADMSVESVLRARGSPVTFSGLKRLFGGVYSATPLSRRANRTTRRLLGRSINTLFYNIVVISCGELRPGQRVPKNYNLWVSWVSNVS
jgi:hypothetical protein